MTKKYAKRASTKHTCPICGATSVSTHHYGWTHGFRTNEYLQKRHEALGGGYTCTAHDPDSQGRKPHFLTTQKAMEHVVWEHLWELTKGANNPVQEEPEEVVLTQALFNRFAREIVRLENDLAAQTQLADEASAEVVKLRHSNEEMQARLNRNHAEAVSDEFRRVYERLR